jgi:hypothetical protein
MTERRTISIPIEYLEDFVAMFGEAENLILSNEDFEIEDCYMLRDDEVKVDLVIKLTFGDVN